MMSDHIEHHVTRGEMAELVDQLTELALVMSTAVGMLTEQAAKIAHLREDLTETREKLDGIQSVNQLWDGS